MSIQDELRRGFRQFKRAVEMSDDARVLFLFQTPAVDGYTEKGSVTDYFFLEHEEQKDGKNIAWLKILNTAANRTLLNSSNHLVFQNLNPLFDGQIFMLNKQFETPSSQLTIRRQINPSGQTYPPAP